MHAEDPTSSTDPGTAPDPDDLPSARQPATHLPRPHQPSQARNPLHGLTLEAIVTQLADFYGWDDLGQRIPLCAASPTSQASAPAQMFAQTPWAREKVESLYLFMLRDQKRQGF